MPVLTKINTNSIAEDAITGDKFSGDTYLENTTTHAAAVETVKTKWPKDNSGPIE